MNNLNLENDLPFEIKSSIEEWMQNKYSNESSEYFWFHDQLNQQLESEF